MLSWKPLQFTDSGMSKSHICQEKLEKEQNFTSEKEQNLRNMNELRQLCVLIMTSFFATATISVMPLFLFKNKAIFTSYFFYSQWHADRRWRNMLQKTKKRQEEKGEMKKPSRSNNTMFQLQVTWQDKTLRREQQRGSQLVTVCYYRTCSRGL